MGLGFDQEQLCSDIHLHVAKTISEFKKVDPSFKHGAKLKEQLLSYFNKLKSSKQILFVPEITLEDDEGLVAVRLYEPDTGDRLNALDELVSPFVGSDF